MSGRRRQKLVDQFQYRLIKRMVVYWAVYQLTLWNVLFCWRLLVSGRGDVFQQYGQFCREFYPMLLCFLVLMPAFTWDAVKFYHRIAGPIVRIKRTARDVAEGRPVRRVVLRKGDQLMELQDDINDMLDYLAQRGAVTFVDPTQDAGVPGDDATSEATGPAGSEEELTHAAR